MSSLAPQHLTRQAALLVLAACLLVVFFLAARHAQADLSFCPQGSGAGQCQEPQGLATDFETDRLYVADRGNHRINVFKASTAEFLFSFGSQGSGAGQLSSPGRIAVDNVVGSPSRHDVYVIGADFRVNRFKPDGSFELAFGWGVDTGAAKLETCTTASGCQAGIEGPSECQLSRSGPPMAVGPAGNVFLADTSGNEPNFTARVQEFSPEGVCVDETTLLKGNFVLSSLAVDAGKDAYVSVDRAGGALRKYDLATPETKLCDLDPGAGETTIETKALALDEADHLFASQRERADKAGGVHQVITEYDVTSCPPTKHVRRFGYGKIETNLNGLAVFHSAQGDVFGTQNFPQIIHYLKAPPAGPLVARTPELLSTGNSRGTVRAEVNPEGKATQVKVEYVDEASFQSEGFSSPNTKSQTKALPTAAGIFRANAVEFLLGCQTATEQLIEQGKCLVPEEEYRWRVIPTNADGPGEGPAEGKAFKAKPPLETEVFASGVDTDTATLNVRANPLGIAATGYFEYVDHETFEESGFAEAIKAPNPEAEPPQAIFDFGSGEAPVSRSTTLNPLQPGTTYRYRLIASDLFFAAIPSEERTFTTFAKSGAAEACPANEEFRSGPSALLPDCRAHELVSPLDKANGDVVVGVEFFTRRPTVLEQASLSGDRLAYGSYRAFGDALSAPLTSQYIAARDPKAGWQSHAINPPLGRLVKGFQDFDNEYRVFSEDLCEGWLRPLHEPPLAEAAIPGFHNLYRRTDDLCEGPDYEAITTAKPQDVPKETYQLEPQGVSADGQITAFVANDSLEGSGAPPSAGQKLQLYVKGPGAGPRFACILPGGAPTSTPCSAGTGPGSAIGKMRLVSVTNALSEDGRQLYWSDSIVDGKIYLRENPLGEGAECSGAGAPCAVAVSQAGETLSGTNASHFWGAAADGSAAIFTTGALLGGKADLYRFTAQGEVTEKIAGQTYGVIGASEDASRLYFASGEVIPGVGQNSEGDEARAGEPNLYLHEADTDGYRFIATLVVADVDRDPQPGQSSATALEPQKRSSRVSATGTAVAFMSAASITGLDNTDLASPAQCGEPKGICDTEVFLYDAEANGGAGEIVCASCNPSGARPAGANVTAGESPFWVAARLPVFETTLYAPRVLAEDGTRLIFESQDALLPRDTNGRLDVYQWERVGKGGCTEADATFSPEANGCIDLISSGQSLRDSRFVDASPTGADVFFATLESLLPHDYGLLDIYDARVEGGFPAPPVPAPECEGETCQSPAGAPEFQTPSTATYQGPGDITASKPKPRPRACPKGKRRVAKGGKRRCAKRSNRRNHR